MGKDKNKGNDDELPTSIGNLASHPIVKKNHKWSLYLWTQFLRCLLVLYPILMDNKADSMKSTLIKKYKQSIYKDIY